ncbi:hypothetical protein PO124_30520 [Bacillus licheniformis]|nr:hypothetical protein [Bacillus licheniformis]
MKMKKLLVVYAVMLCLFFCMSTTTPGAIKPVLQKKAGGLRPQAVCPKIRDGHVSIGNRILEERSERL